MKADHRVQNAIHEIVRRLVSDYHAQKIILFGSYALGSPHKDSDIDLFILKQTPDSLPERMDQVRRLVGYGNSSRYPF